MIRESRVLGLVPARGGSKGFPRKNVFSFAGKPLIVWTIEAAKASKYIDTVAVSTEDTEIANIAIESSAEVPFTRPMELASDDTPGVAVAMHAVENLNGFDYLVYLQPTSPLRTTADIDKAIELCVERSAPVCVSVKEVEKSPYWMYKMDGEGCMHPVVPVEGIEGERQQLPKIYVLNGAIYVARIDWLKNSKTFLSPQTIAYTMPRERSIDIDDHIDMALAELMKKRSSRG